MARPDFWDNQEVAQARVSDLKRLKALCGPVEECEAALGDAEATLELVAEAEDADLAEELEAAVNVADKLLDTLEFQSMLGGKEDAMDAYLSIQAGAGGVDSCDFAEMLLRMFLRHVERRGWKADCVDINYEPDGGISSATLEVKGNHAYGWLKSEMGVHRLVRISPFDAQNRRHTSFAAVDVVPAFEEEAEVEIPKDDVRMDFYRASGAGGQHVNVTDSAVRLTHLPTGLVVTCQNERSQHKNRATAERMLKAKILRQRRLEREEEMKALYGDKGEIAWGRQIRSYVLHPYQMVKDHRTSVETGNTQAVLDGDIEQFMTAYLRQRAGKGDQ